VLLNSLQEICAGDILPSLAIRKVRATGQKKLTFREESKAYLQFFGLSYDPTLPAERLLNEIG